MSDHIFGMVLALATAFLWAATVLLLRRGVEVGAAAANLFKVEKGPS